MSDNVNIIVQDTINEIVVNSAVIVETIDINVQVAVDEVTIIANPNEYIINVNRIIGEQVQSDWNETDDQAPDYIKNKPIIPAAVTKTSDLINDGEDGINPFITLEDIPTPIVPTLQSVTDEGNITTNNIEFETGAGIILDNNSKLKEGTIDAGYGGSKGIAQICAVGYELKWEAGRLYVMGDGGTTIREVSHNFTTIPTIYDDIDKGFIIGSRWILDNGDLYVCLDNSDNTAVWELQGFVPYTGATQDVNLGEFDITAAHLIKDGGVSTQFLKADGSVDNNIYLTSADLPSTLDLYATTTASDVSGYTVLVRNISDSRFNTTAVDVSTGVITTTAQLVGSLVSDANIISGNPGIFNITTIGNISRTSGTGQAEFFFRVYKRDNLGVETFITESSKTLPVTNGGYVEFSAVALWNDGIFTDTDRVVLKYYADRLTSPVGSNPVYKFQFGGISPVRSTAAIPVAVLPNIYLRDLADVENVDALNNEVLYWNDADSLWEHSSVIDLLSPASSTVNGYLTSTDWTAFNGKFNLPSLTSGSVLFSNGTTIAQDNANFFFDDTNKRLSIGNLNVGSTLSPSNVITSFYSSGENRVRLFSSAQITDSLQFYTNGGAYGSAYGEFGFLFKNTSTQMASINFDTRAGIAAPFRFFVNPTGASAIDAMDIFRTGEVGIGTSNTNRGGKLQIKAPGALSTDIALRVRNSADTGDLATIGGTGILTVGGVGNDGSINLARGSNGGIMGGIVQTATITQIHNYQGSGIDFHIAAAGGGQRVFIRGTGVGFSGTTGGTFTLDTSALLQANSTTQGVLFPRMTTTQKNAIATPASGLVVYDTTLGKLCVRGAAAWETITSI